MSDQPTLFDPEPYRTPEKEFHPGDLEFDDWVSHHADKDPFDPDPSARGLVFHGGYGLNGVQVPSMHMGSRNAALHVLEQRNLSFNPEGHPGATSDLSRTARPQEANVAPVYTESGFRRTDPGIGAADAASYFLRHAELVRSQGFHPFRAVHDYADSVVGDEELREEVNRRAGPGRIIARRLLNEPTATAVDEQANAADREFLQRTGAEASTAATTSVRTNTKPYKRLAGQMQKGRPVPYVNWGEDTGGLSAAVPDPANTTVGYWDDVLASPNRSPEDKHHAQWMKDNGRDPHVEFSMHFFSPVDAGQGRFDIDLFSGEISPDSGDYGRLNQRHTLRSLPTPRIMEPEWYADRKADLDREKQEREARRAAQQAQPRRGTAPKLVVKGDPKPAF